MMSFCFNGPNGNLTSLQKHLHHRRRRARREAADDEKKKRLLRRMYQMAFLDVFDDFRLDKAQGIIGGTPLLVVGSDGRRVSAAVAEKVALDCAEAKEDMTSTLEKVVALNDKELQIKVLQQEIEDANTDLYQWSQMVVDKHSEIFANGLADHQHWYDTFFPYKIWHDANETKEAALDKIKAICDQVGSKEEMEAKDATKRRLLLDPDEVAFGSDVEAWERIAIASEQTAIQKDIELQLKVLQQEIEATNTDIYQWSPMVTSKHSEIFVNGLVDHQRWYDTFFPYKMWHDANESKKAALDKIKAIGDQVGKERKETKEAKKRRLGTDEVSLGAALAARERIAIAFRRTAIQNDIELQLEALQQEIEAANTDLYQWSQMVTNKHSEIFANELADHQHWYDTFFPYKMWHDANETKKIALDKIKAIGDQVGKEGKEGMEAKEAKKRRLGTNKAAPSCLEVRIEGLRLEIEAANTNIYQWSPMVTNRHSEIFANGLADHQHWYDTFFPYKMWHDANETKKIALDKIKAIGDQVGKGGKDAVEAKKAKKRRLDTEGSEEENGSAASIPTTIYVEKHSTDMQSFASGLEDNTIV